MWVGCASRVAILRGEGSGFFAKNVLPRLGSSLNRIAVHGWREANIDAVDLEIRVCEHRLKVFVGFNTR